VNSKFVLLGSLVALLTALWAAPVARASDHVYTGTVLSCTYTLHADADADPDVSARTFSASIGSCGSSTDPNGSISGHWRVDGSDTIVTLDTATVSVLGESLDLSPGYDVTVHANIDQLISDVSHAAQTAQAFKDAVGQIGPQLLAAAADKIAQDAGLPSSLDGFNQKLQDLSDHCQAEDGTVPDDPVCLPFDLASADPVGDFKARAGSLLTGDGSTAASSDSDQQRLCPFLNTAQTHAVFVCVPSFVTGDIDTGNKPLLILAGGGLFFLNDPASSDPPTISSDYGVVSLGGIIVGGDLNIDAPRIALAGSAIGSLGDVDLSGDDIEIGQVDGQALLPDLDSTLPFTDWAPEIFSDLHADIKVPATVSAQNISVEANDKLDVAPGSSLTTAGRGRSGGDLPDGTGPGGETDSYGGSHGGYGGFPTDFVGPENQPDRYDQDHGRAPVYDNPFAPDQPGDGGAGEPGLAGPGFPGGGTIDIDAHDGILRVDGKVSADGLQGGFDNDLGTGVGGDATGAGGSVMAKADQMEGTGTVSADGGSVCATCVNSFGGLGGGGRIAVLYGTGKFAGSVEAHGGVDHTFSGPESGDQLVGSGGAGTVFERQVTFDSATGNVDSGEGAYPEGTLIIDGDQAATGFPPQDGTPLDDAWGDPDRRLVVGGRARAIASDLNYGAIDVERGGTIVPPDGDHDIAVTADRVTVRKDSSIDLTGRGFAGGDEADGETAPGEDASTSDAGGSHGGAGGVDVNTAGTPGSTYDDPADPSQPGGGGAGDADGAETGTAGGGVLSMTADHLRLDGVLRADGREQDGPTAIDPGAYTVNGGAGAGGAISLHLGSLDGAGTISAHGGNTCLPDTQLLYGANGCNRVGGSGGGGGGGLIAADVSDSTCGWTGSTDVSGGANLAAADDARTASQGGAGSAQGPPPPATDCTIDVSDPGDSSATDTLRGALESADEGQTVMLPPGVNPHLTLGPIPVEKDITIVGQGSGGSGSGSGTSSTISGSPASPGRLLTVGKQVPDVTAVIKGVNLTGGQAPGGTGPSDGGNGGAIDSGGTLTLDGSTLTGNHAGDATGTGTDGSGGAINNTGTLHVINSTISGNSAQTGAGGIFSTGRLSVANSTIAGNPGGGVGSGGGTASLRGTLLAGNSGGNCAGAVGDGGSNLSFPADGSCPAGFAHGDPKLDPAGPADNGGPTKTIALLPGSAAIDAESAGQCLDLSTPALALGTDQRGLPRPAGAGCDIGAFELQPTVGGATPPGAGPPRAVSAKKCKKKKKAHKALVAKKKCKKKKKK
jgi:hypothetical protein